MTYSAVHDLCIDDREIRVYSNGTGTPVLMLHDLGTSAATFEHLTTPLVRADRELVAIDLLGHGFGGYLAARLAAEHPELIRRLILCEPTAPPKSGPPVNARMSPGMALSGAVTTLRRGKLRQNLQGFSRAKSILDQLSQADPDWWDSLNRITAPTLVLCSGAAEVGERALFDLIAAGIPDSVRATVPGAKKPHTSAPVEFSTQILEFLA